MAKKLYSGRFQNDISQITTEITESISFDHILYKQDLACSKAHVQMLGAQKILTEEQVNKILHGLEIIEKEIEQGKFFWKKEWEDVHTHIENRLVELIGEDGKRLHTGRSRNDQVATDTHLYVLDQARLQKEYLLELLKTIIYLAEKHENSLWAGYTHLQIAQPILLSHYLLSYFWAFRRDLDLLEFAISEANCSPLGAAALGGPNYPISRELTCKYLGFAKLYENSIDAVQNRDYQLTYHFFATRLALHVSRLCEDLIIYSSAEFGYVRMNDTIATGSSIMPQKRNPDLAEILRSRVGRSTGNFLSLIINLKGLPSSYNRDLQEDKIYLFDNVKVTTEILLGLKEILQNIEFFPEKVLENLKKGNAQATDLADYLVLTYKIPFRKAHELTAQLVKYAEEQKKSLSDITKEEISNLWPKEYTFPAEILDVEQSVFRRYGTGSTHPEEVKKQLARAKESLKFFV